MAERAACFFDIDGTIWNEKNEIPESTVEAIHLLQQNGHLVFLNSGRTRGYISNPDLLNIGFDGIVSGCGTMIEYHGETIFYHALDNDFLADTIRLVRSCGFRVILEGKEYLYMDEKEFADDWYGNKLKSEMGSRLLSIEDNWGNWEVSKFSCATDNSDRERAFTAMEKDFDFMIHNEFVAEVVPKGFDKGTGLRKVCELLDVDVRNSYAFGDSVNDIGMLEAAGTSIVMGNGQEPVKKIADHVTAPLMEDGIFKACRHLGLI